MRQTFVGLLMAAGCNFGSVAQTPPDSPSRSDAPQDAAMSTGEASVEDASLADTLPDASTELDTRLQYTWDDRRVVCSKPADDLDKPLDWNRVEEQFLQAEQHAWVALVHAHKPGVTISVDAIDRILNMADAHHLDYVRFDQLSAVGPARAGLAFSFDDDDVDGWINILQPKLAAHGAHITFFVTRWPQLDAARLAELATLAAAGHDLEAHSIDHVDAVAYVTANSLDAYMTNEVVPSIQIMIDAGYHPTSFAFPFGSTTPEISAAILQHVARVRSTPGPCPNPL